jgi:hypothetical protein
MRIDDPNVSAAMEGREAVLNGPIERSHDQPAAFFFVIFGLVYESLATSSTDLALATSTRQPAVIAALQALKCLIRPDLSGKVMLDSVVFEELLNLCYRLAMTESANIQIHLLEVLTILSTCQIPRPSENTKFVENANHCTSNLTNSNHQVTTHHSNIL